MYPMQSGPGRPPMQRNPQGMVPQMQPHRQPQQQQQYQQQPIMQQPPMQSEPFAPYENPEGPIVPSLLADQQSIRGTDPFFGSQPRGNMMQEVFSHVREYHFYPMNAYWIKLICDILLLRICRR